MNVPTPEAGRGAGPVDFFSLDPAALRREVVALGLPAFRANQLLEWVYKKYVADFGAMTNLGPGDRRKLAGRFVFGLPRVGRVSRSGDGMTTKLLLVLADGAAVEGVVMLHPRRRPTLCVSTQVGCAQACLFCATGTMGLRRDMTSGEIVGQIWHLRRHLAVDAAVAHVPTLVFMGMGEPLDNEANFLHALEVLHGPAGFGLGSRKITVSTVGEPARVRRLAELGLQIHLAVSLHAASDALRRKLVPGQRAIPVSEVLAAARHFHERTGREVTFEYVMIDRVNDSEEEAALLARLLKGFPCKVNLIPLNPVRHNRMKTPAPASLALFRDRLVRQGVKVTIRHSQGRDIDAACGQLAVNERMCA